MRTNEQDDPSVRAQAMCAHTTHVSRRNFLFPFASAARNIIFDTNRTRCYHRTEQNLPNAVRISAQPFASNIFNLWCARRIRLVLFLPTTLPCADMLYTTILFAQTEPGAAQSYASCRASCRAMWACFVSFHLLLTTLLCVTCAIFFSCCPMFAIALVFSLRRVGLLHMCTVQGTYQQVILLLLLLFASSMLHAQFLRCILLTSEINNCIAV